MERAASVFNQLDRGRCDRMLVAEGAPIYGFETLAGIDYEIDLSGPPRFGPHGGLVAPEARRIRDARLDGQPVAPEAEVLLVTNSFRATGGGAYPVPGPERIALDPPVGLREIIIDYLADTGAYEERPLASWRFAPLPGASARFCTSPRAVGLLDEVAAHGIRGNDIVNDDGFMVCTLTL